MATLRIDRIIIDSFRVIPYTKNPFRVIGLIDVWAYYFDKLEKVTLAFFRSSGTNSGKIEGLWYPILGLKIYDGRFIEFTDKINYILTETTSRGNAKKKWLAKSIFFNKYNDGSIVNGFSNGKYYSSLLWIGKTLRTLYEKNKYKDISLDIKEYNDVIYSNKVYKNNKYTQRENFEEYAISIYYNN